MIPHPDLCPGPAEFTSTDIALVINKECLTRLMMKVSTTSLGTDRSHFLCVCVVLWTSLGVYFFPLQLLRSCRSEYITCCITIPWNAKCIAVAILLSDDDKGNCLTNVYVLCLIIT